MYCSKCGNELRDGDLFCAKCGTKVARAEDAAATAAPAPAAKAAGAAKTSGRGGKKFIVKRMPAKVLSLGANGGRNRTDTMDDIRRAAQIGQSLGASTVAGETVWDAFFTDGCSSIIFLPFVLFNPLFWMQWMYRSKAKTALEQGDLDLAQQYKSTSTKFAVAGWIVTFVVLFVVLFVIYIVM